MRTKIQRWEHSLAVQIPKPFALELKLTDATPVDLTVMVREARRRSRNETRSEPR